MNEVYYYGVAAMLYLTTCWSFAAVRWFHTCRVPKKNRPYIWPDRKLQVLCYLCSVVLLPYVINPTNQAAWTLTRYYYPATYYFYCGMLLLCFFGTVKQWSRWKSISWVAAIVAIATMLIPILNAWLPLPILNSEGLMVWKYVVMVESALMCVYVGMAMWQVRRWLDEARDANYSNPDDFPTDYAHSVLYFPIYLTPLIWPAYLMDSPRLMAIQHVLLAISNIVLLINVMPVWRRKNFLSSTEMDHKPHEENGLEERIEQTALEIEAYVKGKQAYLDCHLKIDDVVVNCHSGRTYVSLTFQRHFGSFANYVNSLRLAHYEQYVIEHPNETKESAAIASGFSSYNAYYRAARK